MISLGAALSHMNETFSKDEIRSTPFIVSSPVCVILGRFADSQIIECACARDTRTQLIIRRSRPNSLNLAQSSSLLGHLDNHHENHVGRSCSALLCSLRRRNHYAIGYQQGFGYFCRFVLAFVFRPHGELCVIQSSPFCFLLAISLGSR
jgi:hypothetical protein